PCDKQTYDTFMKSTDNDHIKDFEKGKSLEKLAEMATIVRQVINRGNPIFPTSDKTSVQWELDQLSNVKQRLAKAIECKRNYYENSILGLITKIVLKLLCKWNEGDTTAIKKAEDVLLEWDSNNPISKSEKVGNEDFYIPRQDFPGPQAKAQGDF